MGYFQYTTSLLFLSVAFLVSADESTSFVRSSPVSSAMPASSHVPSTTVVPTLKTDPLVTAEYARNPVYVSAPKKTRNGIDMVRKMVKEKGCEVNVCFAIDGSSSISEKQFKIELNIVRLISRLISTKRKINFCGVQYSETTTAISPLTNNRSIFFNNLMSSKQDGGRTNLPAAIGYAITQLFSRKDATNTIIVLGDGLSNIGFEPKFIAKIFLDDGGNIFAIPVGKSDVDELSQITGDKNRVFKVAAFAELVNQVESIVKQTCRFLK